MLVLGEAELRKNQKPFLSGEVEVEVEVDVLGLERRFLPLGGFSGAGLVFFFHLGRRRALIHEKTRTNSTNSSTNSSRYINTSTSTSTSSTSTR